MIKQKVYLLHENLDLLNNVSIGFVFVLILFIDICSSYFFFENLIFIDFIVLHFLRSIKLRLEHEILYQLLYILVLDHQHLQILRALQKLLRYFSGIHISVVFLPPFPILPVTFLLYLNERLVSSLTGKSIISPSLSKAG